MARITSIGMPRKQFVPSAAEEARQASPEAGPSTAAPPDAEEKPKKKVHRSSKKLSQKRARAKAIANGEIILPEPLTAEEEREKLAEEREKQQARNQAKADKQKRKETGETGAGYIKPEGEIDEVTGEKRKVGWGRDEGIAKRARAMEGKGEQRRLQRIDDKQAALTCFGCRQSGHTARDCPQKAGVTGNVCYRCGSKAHPLSGCYKHADPSDPTPFATCFICNEKGHLSSQCPTNEKGVYVNGGECNVCGSVRHLIKDCPTLKARREAAAARDVEREEMSSGIPRTAGADEDDFMVQSRVRMAEMGTEKKGKKEKKPFNNNGLREPYKKEGADGAAGGEGAAPVVHSAPAVAKPVGKAKIVAF